MELEEVIEVATGFLEMFRYTNIEYLGNGLIKTTSPMLQERVFTLAKFGKDYTLYSQKGMKLPLPDDIEIFESEFIEEDEEGNEKYKIYYSDYVFVSEVLGKYYEGKHNLHGVDWNEYAKYRIKGVSDYNNYIRK